MIKATCTWGDGEDILVTLEDHSFMLYEMATDHNRATHGYVKAGSFFLTAKEARELANNLLLAAQTVDELEEDLKNYFEEKNVNLRPIS